MRKHIPFEDLEPWQVAYICNGCGGKGGKVKPPRGKFFKDPCNKHDYRYWLGGNWWDRLLADLGLLFGMLIKCLRHISHLHYLPWCFIYFIGVFFVGFKFFYFSTYKRDLKDIEDEEE